MRTRAMRLVGRYGGWGGANGANGEREEGETCGDVRAIVGCEDEQTVTAHVGQCVAGCRYR